MDSPDSAGSLRVVFMLSDDFDLFKINQEVVFDSAVDGMIGSKVRATIQDDIKRINGVKYLRNCFKEEFLELICMIVKDKDVNKNALSQSLNSYDSIVTEVEERKS